MDKRDELIAAATELQVTSESPYEGMLFDDISGDYFEDEFDFINDFWFGNELTDVPDEYVLFCTLPVHPDKIVLADILDELSEGVMCDDETFDIVDHLKPESVAALGAAIDAFNEANKDVVCAWTPDFTRKVTVTGAEFIEDYESDTND